MMSNVTPDVIAITVLEFLPAFAFALWAEPVALGIQRWPRIVRIVAPALLAIPYAILAAWHHMFRWEGLALYATLPVVIAWLLGQAAAADPEQRTLLAERHDLWPNATRALEWIDRYGDLDVLLANTPNGIVAVDDRCPHKGGPLSQGIVHNKRVTCPLHNFVIELKSGAAVAPDEGCTRAHPTKVENNTVWLCVQTAAAVPAE